MKNNALLDFAEYLTGQESVAEAAKNVRGLKNATTALGKSVEDDSKRIAAGFAAIRTALEQIRGKGEALNIAGSEADRKALRELMRDVEALKASKQRLKDAEAGQAALLKNTEDASKQLTKALREQQQALKAAVAAGDTVAAQKYAAQLLDTRAKTEQLARATRGVVSDFTAVKGSYNNLALETNKLKAELRALDSGFDSNSEHANKLKKQIFDNTQKLKDFDAQTNNAFRSVGQYPSLTAKVGAGVTGLAQSFAGAYFGIQGVATALQEVFAANVAYSDAAAAVRKTTGLSADEFERLAETLKTIDTRTSLQGLLEIATVGGQLGKSKDEIEGFVRSIDVATQALSDDFGGSAETIATSLGKIETVFKKTLGPNQEENLLSIGSALNELAAVGSATAPFLADVALRVGATASNAGLALDSVLSYAAVLQETGTSAEVAGSSLNRLFNTLTTRTEASFNIAKLADANLTLTEFRRLVNTDFQGAVNLFLRGLNAGGTTTTRFNSLLSTLKLQSGEAKSAITTLAKNTELLAERQRTANEQLKTSTSLAAEAAIKNDNLVASTAKLGKEVGNLFTDGAIGGFLKDLVDDARDQLKLLTDGFNLLKSGVLGVKDALAKTSVGKSLGIEAREQENVATAFGKAAKAAIGQADALQKQLDKYNALASQTSKTAEQQRELAQLTAGFQRQLGASVGTINAQTNAFEINTGAVQDSIDARRQLAASEARALERYVSDVAKAIEATQQLSATLNKRTTTAQIEIDKQGLQDAAEQLRALRNFGGNSQTLGPSSGYSISQVKVVEQFLDAERALLENEELLKKQQLDLASAQAALNGVRKAGTRLVKDNKTALDGEIDTEKKKKQSVADLAAEEFKLAKQRAEARIADLDRQAENPANSEAVRTRALQKAAQERIILAGLEQREGGRLAAQSNKDKIDGDKATAIARVGFAEKYANEVLGINRKLSKDELALRTLLLDQLAAVDKLALDAQIEELNKIAEGERFSYAERQQAALDASARRIELILIESDIKRRAAKGDAAELLRIQQEQDKQTAAVLRESKPFDSGKYIEDVRKRYAQEGIILEDSRAKQVITERQYIKQTQDLENEREKESIDAIEREFGLTAEVLERRRALRKKIGEQELDEEKRIAQLRAELIQEGLNVAQQVGDTLFKIQRDRLDAQMALEQHAYELQLEGAGDNAELRAQIEEAYQKRLLEQKRKQAKADRNAALFAVALNTAQAVTSVLSTGGGARYADFGISAATLSAIVIATGALQAGAILAQPLPQFYKGTDYSPEGFAHVAERGPELVQDRSGGMQLVQKPSILYLKEGSKVLTADKTREYLRTVEAPAFPRFGESLSVAQQQLTGAAPMVIRLDKLEQGQDRLADLLSAQKAYHTRNTRSLLGALGSLQKVDRLNQWAADRVRGR